MNATPKISLDVTERLAQLPEQLDGAAPVAEGG